MSIERCHSHDETFDTDFRECCPKCERDPLFDADVALAESMMDFPVAEFGDVSQQFEVQS